jgi:acetyl-CoA carboxylase biotin carboxyl carrier protein
MLFNKAFSIKDSKDNPEAEVSSILDFLDIYDQNGLESFYYENELFSISLQSQIPLEAPRFPYPQDIYRGPRPIDDVTREDFYQEASSYPVPIQEIDQNDYEKEPSLIKPLSSENTSSNTLGVKATMAGSYYPSREPGAAPLVKLGDSVQVGQVVCLLESMKLFTEVKTEVAGTITKIYFKEGDLVAEGDVLFEIDGK